MSEPWLKLRPSGRGRNYSPGRGLVESTLRLAYTPGHWPAKLWGLWPASRRVSLIEHHLPLLPLLPLLPRSPAGEGRRPLRIAFLSDLHLGPTTSPATLDRAFAIVD
nr:hypothetical protein [Polyangiaceae bacterium]